jgi:hypothetical protein
MIRTQKKLQKCQRALLRKAFVLLCALCGVSTAFACTIPVFRFALDRWEADPFRLVIPSSWVTQPDMIKLLVPLRGNAEANIKIEETSDAAITEAKLLFPHHDVALWSGKLDTAALAPLLDSPARQELLKRVLNGDSAVWVVCTKEADKAEADRVDKRLRYLEQVAALPVQDPKDPDSQLGPGPPLKLKFSVLRVSLDDPAEKLFASMVAGPKQQDFIAKGTSFAGPVFAKGRVLGAWALSELDDTAIEDASLFLIGRCSCRIKNENPGWDVVLKTDWERELAKAHEEQKVKNTAGGEESAGAGPPPAPAAAVTVSETPQGMVLTLDGTTASASPAGKATPTLVTTSSSATGVVTQVVAIPIPAIAVAALAVIALVSSLFMWLRK